MATTKAIPMRHCREAPAHITKLAYLFPIHADETSSREQPFVDEDFRGIMEVLREFGYMTWAVIPRTYAILRLIRRIEDMDDFLEQNLSDLSIPYTNDNLPINLSQSTKASFLKVQHLVLTSAMDLERGEAGEHKHIKSHEELQFDVVGELGRGGGCTQVQKVWSNIGRALYAVKFIRRGEYFQGDRNALRDFEGELQSAKKVLHHHVVKIVGSFTEEKYVGIIMETVGEMNLGQLLKRPINADTKSSLRTYFGCLASGLFAIHQVGIKHKDVKPENIVIRKSIAYFTDFGLALDFSTTEENRSTTMGKPAVKYTALYSAPEWWAWSERNTLSDIWSLGAVYLEMATVLYGETVHKLWDFLANHGTQNTVSYSRNLSGVLEWIGFLRSKPSHETDTVALDVVEATMKEAKEKRPKSYQLWKMIEKQAPRHVSFACRACVESFHPTERPTQRPPGRGQLDSAPEFSRLEPVASRQELIYPEIHEFQHPISLPEPILHEAGLVRNDTVI
ncbi:kinase-like domain-containing protein, partial [Bisporella sp. PMI_857]